MVEIVETANQSTDVVDEDAVVISDDGEGVDDAELAKLPKNATMNADGTVTLKLRSPVSLKVGGAETVYSQLVFHDITGGDLAEIAATKEQMRMPSIIARSIQLKLAFATVLFNKMGARDARKALLCAQYFLGDGE